MSTFTDHQRQILLSPIDGFRVKDLDGQSHLAAWDVAAHLNRVFGFEGWDKEILSLELVYEHVGQRTIRPRNKEPFTVPACSVGYRCTMRLTLRNPAGEVVRVVEDAAMGTATNQRDLGDAHDLAVKSAVSYALKRCAKDLGDQFGLSLYNGGQQSACVQVVWPYAEDKQAQGFEVNVQGDGISEGDGEFGASRGEQDEPEPVEPVREPAPKQAKPAPEATAPAERSAPPTLSETDAQTWVETVASVKDADTLRQVWNDAKAAGVLDSQISVQVNEDQGYTTTIREHIVARLNQIEEEAQAS